MIHFSRPGWSLAALALYMSLAIAYLRIYWRTKLPAPPSARARTLKYLLMHASAALLLILAAGGPEWPASARNLQIVIAADVSDSLENTGFLPRETALIPELLAPLGPDTEVGVVVFGRSAATERPLSALPPDAFEPRGRRSVKTPALQHREHSGAGDLPPLPALEREQRSADISTDSTDIGGAIDACRNLFPAAEKTRAILMLSDFRDTEGHARAAAAALSGSGIDLLTAPAMLGAVSDAHIAAIHTPDSAQAGHSIPIEVTVSALSPRTVRVELWRQAPGAKPLRLPAKNVEITRESGPPNSELTRTVRFEDAPDAQGVAVYSTRIGAERESIAPDPDARDTLSAAVRITGKSHWAVLCRPESTLKSLAGQLDVDCHVFETGHFPARGADYNPFSGVLVDGLSESELPAAALDALEDAVKAGKGLVAIGGERAFGAGKHPPDQKWEQLLPILMTPEDDRTRSVLFLIDISASMDDLMSNGGGKKLDFAEKQLAAAVQKLKPLDRVGLITFTDVANYPVALNTDPQRTNFLDALSKLKTNSNTDLYAPLEKSREILKDDDAEEQLVVLLSDGQMTTDRPSENVIAAARTLCPEPAESGAPRRTTVFTFGIGTDPRDNAVGDKLMNDIAAAGGGEYSPEFDQLATRLEKAFDSQKKGFYKRREPYLVRASGLHPLLANIGNVWPQPMQFRNRVKAKPDAEVLLSSASLEDAHPGAHEAKSVRRPDPLLVISGATWPKAARCAAAAFSWDDQDGELLLGSPAGQKLLPALLQWAEAKDDALPPGWTLIAEPTRGGDLSVELRAADSSTGAPANGLAPTAQLIELDPTAPKLSLPANLIPAAPGIYRATFKKPASGRVHKLVVSEGASTTDRFVTIPFSAETTQLGVDRSAMKDLLGAAGGDSRAIERPAHLKEWADAKALSQATRPLMPWLVGAAMALLLALFLMRQK